MVALLLAGCESLPDWSTFTRAAATAAPARYSFGWTLSGDRAVSPLQVFDDGVRTWLQFPEHAAIPAVFFRSAPGDVPLIYQREGPYVVLRGVWPLLAFRGGNLEGLAARGTVPTGTPPRVGEKAVAAPPVRKTVPAGTVSMTPTPPKPLAPSPAVFAALPAAKSPPAATLAVRTTSAARGGFLNESHTPGASAEKVVGKGGIIAEGNSVGADSRRRGAFARGIGQPAEAARRVPRIPLVSATPSALFAPGSSPGRSDSTAALPVVSPVSARPPFEVSPKDGNIRRALGRWAKVAGWTFGVEHWAVDVDVPIVAAAHFESGFKSSVQALLAATELGDRPLRPCFYSNKVVRVVPYAQICDRARRSVEPS